jgi:predicted dehydrogenase
MTRRAGIIGYGLAGRVFHAPLIDAEPGLELAAIVTGDPGRAGEASLRYPQARIVPNVDELLEEHLDLIVVAGPTPRHVELAERAIDAGIAVVVDKPLAVHAEDAGRLVERAESRGVPLTVFQNRRFDGDFLTVEKLIREGRLGEVWRFESRFEWISSRPRPEWKVGTTGAEGGGVAYDLGSHLIDQAIRLFGPVADVYGELNVRRHGGANDDDAFIALTHTSGVRSHLGMASLVAQRGFRFRVLGSESAYTKWGLDPQEGQLARGMSPLDGDYGVTAAGEDGRIGQDGETETLPTERGDYRAFYRDVAAAVDGTGPMPVNPRDAIEPIRIIERLQAQQ